MSTLTESKFTPEALKSEYDCTDDELRSRIDQKYVSLAEKLGLRSSITLGDFIRALDLAGMGKNSIIEAMPKDVCCELRRLASLTMFGILGEFNARKASQKS